MIQTHITRIELTLDELKKIILEHLLKENPQYKDVTLKQVTIKSIRVSPRDIVNSVAFMIFNNEDE